MRARSIFLMLLALMACAAITVGCAASRPAAPQGQTTAPDTSAPSAPAGAPATLRSVVPTRTGWIAEFAATPRYAADGIGIYYNVDWVLDDEDEPDVRSGSIIFVGSIDTTPETLSARAKGVPPAVAKRSGWDYSADAPTERLRITGVDKGNDTMLLVKDMSTGRDSIAARITGTEADPARFERVVWDPSGFALFAVSTDSVSMTSTLFRYDVRRSKIATLGPVAFAGHWDYSSVRKRIVEPDGESPVLIERPVPDAQP
jgi:hypothetical protein